MTVWLYTEERDPIASGPFLSIIDALKSPLWELERACVWCEAYETGRGWAYENAKWCGDHWLVTSHGIRPAEPIRPSFLIDALANGAKAAAGCGPQGRAGRASRPFLVQSQRN